ncbi:MAG TPA: SMC family ATPase [Candidatus Binatia bacterium]|nr:SMC family ATPase [Candidatus Binatia bacterium]
MRPQRLTLKNFMPFRSTNGEEVTVDFSPLDLFAITGPMASGKSSLIDAIVWCLYGRTARYGADSRGVISAGESICEVAFDFTIGPRWFRAVRRTGKTTESGLSELENGEWVQDISGSDHLTNRIEGLLGLDFDSFTKTVILPQGRYAEFLGSEPSKRRELLEKILELGVYKRVADRAKDTETRAKERARTIRETLAQPQYAGVTRALAAQQQEQLALVVQQISTTSALEEVLQGLFQRAEEVTNARSRLTNLQEGERTRAQERELARQKQEAAEAQRQTFVRTLAEAAAERAALGYDARRHETVKRAVAHVREYEAALQEVGKKNLALSHAQRALDTLAHQISVQEQAVAHALRIRDDRAAVLAAEIAANGDVARLSEKINEAKRWKELGQEQQLLAEQHRMSTQQLFHTRQALTPLLNQEAVAEQTLRDLRQQGERAREEENEKARLVLEAEHLGKDLREAAQGENRALQAVEKARTDLAEAEQTAQRHHDAVMHAEQQEQLAFNTLEESRRQHEVEHLRTTLQVGEPCPVCQTPVRVIPPLSPAAQADVSALQHAYETAKATTTRAQQELQKVETSAAALRARYDGAERDLAEKRQKRREAQQRFISHFPGFSSLAEAQKALQTQRQEIIARLRTIEANVQGTEKEKQTLSRRRETAQQEEAKLTEALRRIADQTATGSTQLAVLSRSLAAYLSGDEDPESTLTIRRQALLNAEQEVKAADLTCRQEENNLSALKAKRSEADKECSIFTSERNHAADRVEREARAVRENLELASDAPLPVLADLEQTLGELARRQEQHITLVQREESLQREHERAERQALELRTELQACERELHKARQAVARGETVLAEARTEFQAAARESGLLDLGPEGENLKGRLDDTRAHLSALQERRGRLAAEVADVERRCVEKEQEEEKLCAAETEGRLAADLRRLLGAEFTDYLSEGAVEALMHDAGVHLQKLTHNRYSFKIEYKRRSLELLIVDHEDQQRARPTHSLSGGETFLASLAIALALSQGFREVAAGKAAKTSTECLILDEGFGTLDREGLQLVTETLQELRGEEGRMVGIITHVEEVAAAMPTRIEVRRGSRTSTVTVTG